VSFRHFWHMVIQEKVTVIVMITRLKEGTKRKADQYWPDLHSQDLGPVLDLGGGYSIEHTHTAKHGTYTRRNFTLHLPGGEERDVVQLHTENWPEQGVPSDPRVLVDLVYKAEELLGSSGRMLVQCSAGVGRTGTFLALYNLWREYQDPSITTISLLPTVLALRQQRKLMVQRPVQYGYIVTCLSYMVSTEEEEYYDYYEYYEEEEEEEYQML